MASQEDEAKQEIRRRRHHDGGDRARVLEQSAQDGADGARHQHRQERLRRGLELDLVCGGGGGVSPWPAHSARGSGKAAVKLGGGGSAFHLACHSRARAPSISLSFQNPYFMRCLSK